MAGLLYSAYQKFYSALSHLARFDKESNFFDNISAIDNFFSEYRNITFVMQKSLKHTQHFSVYEKNRNHFLTDRWLVDKRNKTIKEKPFDLIKEIVVTLYLPFGGVKVSEKAYSVASDEQLESIIAELKGLFCEIDSHEVFFSVSFSFHEAGSDINLLKRVLQGVSSMKSFMDAMEKDIGEQCQLCDQLKTRINNMHLAEVPLDILLVNDYTYYPDKDYFDKAERFSVVMSQDGKKVASHQPLSCLTEAKYFNYDGTVFGNFTFMHAILRAMHPGMNDIMPAIMVVYDDNTYDLDVFHANMKTTMYRKMMETSQLVDEQNVTEVCYMSLYSSIPISPDLLRISRERIQQSTSDMLVCASINKMLQEKEYIFEGKYLENIQYVACVMKNGLRERLSVSANNLFPIKCAFEKKLK